MAPLIIDERLPRGVMMVMSEALTLPSAPARIRLVGISYPRGSLNNRHLGTAETASLLVSGFGLWLPSLRGLSQLLGKDHPGLHADDCSLRLLFDPRNGLQDLVLFMQKSCAFT